MLRLVLISPQSLGVIFPSQILIPSGCKDDSDTSSTCEWFYMVLRTEGLEV